MGAIAIADLVKTTLGPKGMDKILQSLGDEHARKAITVTNDGATILGSIYVDNPAAKILIDISKTQDEEVGDGTTTVAVMAGELLKEAEKLVNQRIHPQIIIKGWRAARDVAKKVLEEIAMDNSANEEAFKQDLKNIALTTLSSKLLLHDREKFAQLAVDSVLRLKGSGNMRGISNLSSHWQDSRHHNKTRKRKTLPEVGRDQGGMLKSLDTVERHGASLPSPLQSGPPAEAH